MQSLIMINGLTHLHNLLRWVILVLLIISIVRHFAAMTGAKAYTGGDRKRNLFLMITAHIQLLIGLVQWFFGDWGLKLLQNAGGFGAVMKDTAHRFWTIEHNIGMLLAIILITVGRGVYKKNLTDRSKHKRSFWYFLVALLLILAVIPWPGRPGIGRPMFPGM